ncbi:hypothetical protein C1H76_3581 [Elsinoe australis]|uniref:Uncharacterized protein n=1 Tax=Elsinoe australis TaxID=40998 RepID=A0A4U7B4P5_9PEZI|nr:hypothetical protein C1H76_3581 [Elsinoe australis]
MRPTKPAETKKFGSKFRKFLRSSRDEHVPTKKATVDAGEPAKKFCEPASVPVIPKPQASVTVPKRHDSQIGDISPQPIQASATSKALPTVAGLHNRAFGKAFLTLNAEQQKHVKAIYFEIYGLITAPNFALSVIKSQYNGL